MRHRLTIALLATTTLVAALTPLRAGAEEIVIVREHHVVDTEHGKIYVEVARPEVGGKPMKAPAILTYSPYSILQVALGGTRTADGAKWVPEGYARVWADVVGTGDSGGCWDYGGDREKETGYDVVEWIADQPWSTGKVAMMGGSYEGTTAISTAITSPPHLTTIIPQAAISRWYEYAYSGGIRYFLNNEGLSHQGPGAVADEGFDTPGLFDFGLAVPPPVDAQTPGWQERFASTVTPCDEVTHTEHGYDDTPDYDAFWEERDYILDADRIDIPVLVSHNWGDWNVKQEEAVNLYRALTSSPKATLYMGTRWSGHGTPGGDYDKTVDRWLAHYLKGENNGIPKLPDVISERSDSEGPAGWYRGDWPKTKPLRLVAQETVRVATDDYTWELLPHPPEIGPLGEPSEARYNAVGANTEAHANHHPQFNHEWFWFESPPLKRDVRIFGEIKVQVRVASDREWVTMTPVVVDVDPADHEYVEGQHVTTDPGALIAVTRGFLDSRYREGLDHQVSAEPMEPLDLTVVQKPQDYTFLKGHRIALNISSEINEWAVPKLYPCASADCPLVRVLWEDGETQITLPIVGAPRNPHKLFAADVHA